MNLDRFTSAIGVTDPVVPGGLPLADVDGRPVTVAVGWSAEALHVAARRRTALVIVDPGDTGELPPIPPIGSAWPWPVVAVSASPWSVRAADLGLLVGVRGPADRDGLDEVEAATLTRSFLSLSVDAEQRDPCVDRSLLDVVPFPIDQPYEPEQLLEVILDAGEWVELDAGAADEVLTAVARVGGRSVGVAASRPSVDSGRLGPAAVARVTRLLQWCDRGSRPLVTFVDTAGMLPPADGGELQLLRGAATSVRISDVVKVAVVTGRAVGLAATVMGAVGGRADAVVPWPRAHFALASDPPMTPGSDEAALAAVERAAREGDLMDVIHPDDTRGRLIELLDLLRGQREYAP